MKFFQNFKFAGFLISFLLLLGILSSCQPSDSRDLQTNLSHLSEGHWLILFFGLATFIFVLCNDRRLPRWTRGFVLLPLIAGLFLVLWLIRTWPRGNSVIDLFQVVIAILAIWVILHNSFLTRQRDAPWTPLNWTNWILLYPKLKTVWSGKLGF